MSSRKRGKKKHSNIPLYFIGAPASVAVWAGWVGLGGLCGFGPIHLFPGVTIFGLSKFVLNTAITLPIGVEAYGMYAMGSWLDRSLPEQARRFAKWSAIGSLGLGMLGQIAYHLLSAVHAVQAPWPVTMCVACLPVIALGLGAGLAHLRRAGEDDAEGDEHQDTPSTPQRPLEALTAATRPSMSTYSTATAEPVTDVSEPVSVAPESSVPRPVASGAPRPVASGAPRPVASGAPRQARTWSRDRRIKAEIKKNPDIKGAELGRKLGYTERHGQRLRQNALKSMGSI